MSDCRVIVFTHNSIMVVGSYCYCSFQTITYNNNNNELCLCILLISSAMFWKEL